MVFGQNVTENKLLGLLENRAVDNPLGVPATYEWGNTNEELIHQVFVDQSAINGGASFGQHNCGSQCCHLMECFGKIDGADAALQNVGMFCYPIQSRGVGIFGCHHNGTLIRSSEHWQRQIKIESPTYNRYACYWPRPVGKASRFCADAARWRGVTLGHSGGASDQNDVREGAYGAEDVFVSWSSQGPGDSTDLCGAIDCRDHVHHQPRAAVNHRSTIAVGVVGIDLDYGWR